MIKKGSSGEEVKKLQQKLGLNPDGVFGDMTESQLKKWQSQNGLVADGIAGDETLKKMGLVSQPTSLTTPVTPAPITSGPVNITKLKGVIPDSVLALIPDTASKFQINSALRLSHFLAQCSHESGNFSVVKENLNYSAQGLANTWPSRFAVNPKDKVKTPNALANQIQKNPILIANNVYADRMGNGNAASGDGFKYAGKGYIQLTGKDNYKAFGTSIGEDCIANPEIVATKYPLMSAAWFFSKNGLWAICDKGESDAVVEQVTKRVNGGTIGLDDRISKFKKYKSLLS